MDGYDPLSLDTDQTLTLDGDYFEVFEMKVERLLWSGRFGDVLLARSERYPDVTRVVRKAGILENDLKRHSWSLEELKRILYREAALLKHSTHNNVIGGVNLIECPEYILVAMDYCSEGSLLARIRRIDHIDMFNFGTALISALNYLHNNRIFHSDIKPSKLLVMRNTYTDYERPVLAGFSLARRCDNPLNVVDSYYNSVSFRVPEVWSARGTYSVNPFKCDLYKFGLVLLCMVLKVEQIDWALYRDPWELALTYPYIGFYISFILKGCLHHDPSNRLTTDAAYVFWSHNIRPQECRPLHRPVQRY